MVVVVAALVVGSLSLVELAAWRFLFLLLSRSVTTGQSAVAAVAVAAARHDKPFITLFTTRPVAAVAAVGLEQVTLLVVQLVHQPAARLRKQAALERQALAALEAMEAMLTSSVALAWAARGVMAALGALRAQPGQTVVLVLVVTLASCAPLPAADRQALP
jgi:hypothetical protein